MSTWDWRATMTKAFYFTPSEQFRPGNWKTTLRRHALATTPGSPEINHLTVIPCGPGVPCCISHLNLDLPQHERRVCHAETLSNAPTSPTLFPFFLPTARPAEQVGEIPPKTLPPHHQKSGVSRGPAPRPPDPMWFPGPLEMEVWGKKGELYTTYLVPRWLQGRPPHHPPCSSRKQGKGIGTAVPSLNQSLTDISGEILRIGRLILVRVPPEADMPRVCMSRGRLDWGEPR